MTILDRYALDAYREVVLGGVTHAEARKIARKSGLLVHKNQAGTEFVSHPTYERRHPLNPTD